MHNNRKFSCPVSAAGILLSISLGLGQPAKAEGTYNAGCMVVGDSITLTSTGELVLEQRLVSFKADKSLNPRSDVKGICVMKKDPPGYKWVQCWKQDGRYATGNFDNPHWIKPTQAIANSVQYRGWGGACKVSL